MSLFKKPKRNIRQRNFDTDEEENGKYNSEPMETDFAVGNGVKKSKEKDKTPKTTTLLSFADDEGNIFLLKTSLIAN